MIFIDLVFYDFSKFKHIFNSSYFIDLSFFYLYLSSIFVLIFILIFLNFFLSNSFLSSDNKYSNSSYECGFDPMQQATNYKFPVYYFRLSLFFLIFDLEVLYIYPWVSVAKFFFMSKLLIFFFSFFPIIFILFLGLIYEYSLDLFDWN